MPTCLECRGTGQIEVKTEITKRCPDCDGTKELPDGTACKRCNQWGEIGTGKFNVEQKLCKTCMGSGRVSESSLTIWFLVRAVPAALILVVGGSVLSWLSWSRWGIPWVTTLLLVLFFGLWGGLMYYFISQMPDIGEISPTNWFLIRSIPTTLIALAAGGSIIWSSWVYLQNAPVSAIIAIAVFATWGILMFYFISHMPE